MEGSGGEILDISASDYSFSEINSNWASQFSAVRCRRCGQTHAVMPSFSLPGTSVGTAEAEGYMLKRHRDASSNEAGER